MKIRQIRNFILRLNDSNASSMSVGSAVGGVVFDILGAGSTINLETTGSGSIETV